MHQKKLLVIVTAMLTMVFILGVSINVPTMAYAENSDTTVSIWRVYNPNSGEHFYTENVVERDTLIALGWTLEGVGWVAPTSSSTPVYRLYNPNAGDHHYTTSESEKDYLVSVGWTCEGIGWYSDDSQTVAVLREYNPNAVSGTHNFTTSQSENDNLVSVGWNGEGIGWYAVEAGTPYSIGSNIMGTSKTTVEQMVAWYNSKGHIYPSDSLSAGGASTIADFAEIVYEEAEAEGVRAEVVFCQAMKETGWLQFGGQVDISQYNFAGLGALDGGEAGASFSDVREGIRAQVQHLKLYASTENLNNACVDPRWDSAVQKYGRGSSPSVEGLTGKWATASDYGSSLLGMMNELIAY